MNVLIFGNTYKLECKIYIEALINELLSRNVGIVIYKPFYEFWNQHLDIKTKSLSTFKTNDDIVGKMDYMFSLGGDGTFLESVQFVKNKEIPIIGINMGRLGFLASITQEEAAHAVSQIFDNNYSIEERSLLHFTDEDEKFQKFPYALNDVTVQKKDTSMITIHTFLNNEYLNTYWADGLIISTSTGSTAYSLSVGGPIVLPNSKNIVICPIAPHNLSVRPIVVPDNFIIKLKIESRSETFLATVDNRTEVMDINREIILKSSDFKIKMLHLKNYNFYHTIRNKLLWGFDKRN